MRLEELHALWQQEISDMSELQRQVECHATGANIHTIRIKWGVLTDWILQEKKSRKYWNKEQYADRLQWMQGLKQDLKKILQSNTL